MRSEHGPKTVQILHVGQRCQKKPSSKPAKSSKTETLQVKLPAVTRETKQNGTTKLSKNEIVERGTKCSSDPKAQRLNYYDLGKNFIAIDVRDAKGTSPGFYGPAYKQLKGDTAPAPKLRKVVGLVGFTTAVDKEGTTHTSWLLFGRMALLRTLLEVLRSYSRTYRAAVSTPRLTSEVAT